MRILFTLFFLSVTFHLHAALSVKIYYENSTNGYVVFADNQESCPISIQLDLQLNNLTSTKGNHQIFVIPASTEKHSMTELVIEKKGKPHKFSYKYYTNRGNHFLKQYDQNFNYYLPYGRSKTFTMSQGYNGKFSHRNENALDFTMPIGTEIRAIRGGIVVKVVQKHSKHCTTSDCEKYNNYILVYHSDGTFSEYSHIKKNGALVNAGDRIKQNDAIALSGNVGWSSGPHLHLVVYIQRLKNRESLKTKFLVNKGKPAIYLEERKNYLRDY